MHSHAAMKWNFAAGLALMLFPWPAVASPVEVRRNGPIAEMDNGRLKVQIEARGNQPVQRRIFARRGTDWKLVIEGFAPDYTSAPVHAVSLWRMEENDCRHLVTALPGEILSGGEPGVLRLRMMRKGAEITETLRLEPDAGFVHVEVAAKLPAPELDFLLSAYTFGREGVPEFVHTPGVKFDDPRAGAGRDQITGDRSFHAPAVILQHGPGFAALVPDLDHLSRHAVVSADARRAMKIGRGAFSLPDDPAHFTMPAGLDLNVKSGHTPRPVMTFGLMDSIIGHHIRYVREGRGRALVRQLAAKEVSYAFDLFADAEAPPGRGFERIPPHQWAGAGRRVFREKPHVAMPFAEYVRLVSRTVFSPVRMPDGSPVQTPAGIMDPPLAGWEDHGSWLEWTLEGREVGGFRSSVPFWNDVIHQSAFWNGARDATGMHYWGRELGDDRLMHRARRIIELCLSAPRNAQGLFHTVFNAGTGKWGRGWTDPMHGKQQLFLRDAECYEIATLCKTGAHLLDYHFRAERHPRIIEYLQPFAGWLAANVDARGTVPAFVGADMVPSPLLRDSAHPAAAMWFLAEMHAATGDDTFLAAARRIAAFLEQEIMPDARWIDFEQYLSCGAKPFTMLKDEWQGQWFRGNLCIIWAAEGFAALHRTDPSPRWLELGARCLDYLSFTQCVWQPPFIYTANPFGGFGVDNSDSAPMLDQRQAETVRPWLYFGRMLGRQDFIERGIAGARSGCVLIVHARHRENGIFPHPRFYPEGMGPENIDHEAHPQCPMRTHPCWGEGSSVFTGLGEAHRALGGLFVDVERQVAAGVDGVRVVRATFAGGTAHVEVESIVGPAALKRPWEQPFRIPVRGRGKVVINGTPVDTGAPAPAILTVLPDGKIVVTPP